LKVKRYQGLLASLLGLIVVQPFLRGAAGRMALIAVFSAILLTAVWGLEGSRRGLALGLALALVALIGNWTSVFVESAPLVVVSRGATIGLLLLVTVALLTDIARQTRIQPETIYQAACVYLIIGVIFALLYAAVSEHDPGAFAPVAAPAADSAATAPSRPAITAKWVYFSFVTLTTVGYGDITPVAPAARSLAIVEALLGQFFVAVLVARLVGLLQTQRPGE